MNQNFNSTQTQVEQMQRAIEWKTNNVQAADQAKIEPAIVLFVWCFFAPLSIKL